MQRGQPGYILTLNSGSSSLEFAVFRDEAGEPLVLAGKLKQVGTDEGHFAATGAEGRPLMDEARALPDHGTAFDALFGWLQGQDVAGPPRLVGHRVVHGGLGLFAPQRIDDDVLRKIRAAEPLAPAHVPPALAGIEQARAVYPDVPQLACFDTFFHRDLPGVAQVLPLPRRYQERGLRRLGFHGLSYEYIVQAVEAVYRDRQAPMPKRMIVAHLGSGASMAAVQDGRCVETTMGLTPAAGLVMSTRSGDVDPGALAYLAEEEGLSGHDLNRLVNEEAGLLGVSGFSADMEALVEKAGEDERADHAVGVFCYSARKHLGALTAVLGGLDVLVFTGGIGARAAAVRARICEGLDYLGLALDAERNRAGERVISAEGRPVTVFCMETDEQRVIVQHARAFLEAERKSQKVG